VQTSRIAAPVGEVITPMRRGRRGQGLLVAQVEQPFGREPLLEFLEAAAQQALAGLLEVLDHQLEFAARLVEAHAAAGQHLRAVAHRKRTSRLRLRNMAQRTCAASSFSEKYQWPEPGRERFEISPSIHSEPSRARAAREPRG